MKTVPRPGSFRIGRREADATRKLAPDELSGLTLAFVTISTGLPDADAGRGSACMHPLNTTSRLGLAFGCPAAVAARHRHVMAESPIRLIVHLCLVVYVRRVVQLTSCNSSARATSPVRSTGTARQGRSEELQKS